MRSLGDEYEGAEFGDQRLNDRVKRLVGALSARPCDSFPDMFTDESFATKVEGAEAWRQSRLRAVLLSNGVSQQRSPLIHRTSTCCRGCLPGALAHRRILQGAENRLCFGETPAGVELVASANFLEARAARFESAQPYPAHGAASFPQNEATCQAVCSRCDVGRCKTGRAPQTQR